MHNVKLNTLRLLKDILPVVVSAAMSWDDLYRSSRTDTDLRNVSFAGSTGSSMRSSETTAYQHLFGGNRDMENHPNRNSDVIQV